MRQQLVENWQIKRMNQLFHEEHLTRVTIAKRLGISRTTVRTYLMSLEQWKERRKQLG
ncbi:HTH domain-containing protein [Allocoleopsis franciscana]|uniref:Transcriptional regulator with sigma factor-related N-terminal domain n=1 Tax=Allocoleopsis franciscana PCC 7113 TaxID=1173027 RepID=K9WRH1_9CYAN|nr:HTH domain-containing protein [Allocoleopsis franciscana]AFZ22379.1 transcriptional regulator with sigma factor-related N-terminal domain [Allocoleopsis franciscana PCC 7113]